MKHGTYIGPCSELNGKTALIRQSCEGAAFVRVQFDDSETLFRGKLMGFCWHRFLASDFRLDPAIDWSAPC